jgi:hypothetical protein
MMGDHDVVIGSVGIAVLQMPASRLARRTGPAARTAFGAGGWLLVAAVFLACSAPVPALARRAGRTR